MKQVQDKTFTGEENSSQPILLGDRLKAIRKRNRWTQEELAEALCVSKSYVSQVEIGAKDGGPKLLRAIESLEQSPISAAELARQKNAPNARLKAVRDLRAWTNRELASHLGVPLTEVTHLLTGDKAPTAEIEQFILRQEVSLGLAERGDIMRDVQVVSLTNHVPILSYAQMGALTSYEELPHEFSETIPTNTDDPKAFALRLRGDSMEPEYKDGTIAVLRPSSEPQQHQPVVARLKDGSVVFKIYVREKEKVVLQSLNPKYDPIRVEASEVSWIYPVDSVHRLLWK